MLERARISRMSPLKVIKEFRVLSPRLVFLFQRKHIIMSRPIASSSSSRASAEMAMRQSMERTNQALTNSRPANTTKAYDPKIEEFRAWCDEKFSHEPKEVRYIVYGEKAHFFLDDAVNRITTCNKYFSY